MRFDDFAARKAALVRSHRALLARENQPVLP
jgi:hypothetical protein